MDNKEDLEFINLILVFDDISFCSLVFDDFFYILCEDEYDIDYFNKILIVR